MPIYRKWESDWEYLCVGEFAKKKLSLSHTSYSGHSPFVTFFWFVVSKIHMYSYMIYIVVYFTARLSAGDVSIEYIETVSLFWHFALRSLIGSRIHSFTWMLCYYLIRVCARVYFFFCFIVSSSCRILIFKIVSPLNLFLETLFIRTYRFQNRCN